VGVNHSSITYLVVVSWVEFLDRRRRGRVQVALGVALDLYHACEMSKRTHWISPATQPPRKRQRLSKEVSKRTITFDSALVDELVLTIFAYLEAVDLCRAQRVNKAWGRLATDNQVII